MYVSPNQLAITRLEAESKDNVSLMLNFGLLGRGADAEKAHVSNRQCRFSNLLSVILQRAAQFFPPSALYSSELFFLAHSLFEECFSYTYTFQLHCPTALWVEESAGDALSNRAHVSVFLAQAMLAGGGNHQSLCTGACRDITHVHCARSRFSFCHNIY